MKSLRMYHSDTHGFTIPELIVSIVILTMLAAAVMGAYTTVVGSAAKSRLISSGLGLATEQLELLRSLSYDSLAVVGGTINSSGEKLPATNEVTVGNYTFIVTTTIQYADDAFDGCLSYPAAQAYLCRNGPPKSGLPVDTNPKDYKLADVVVTEKNSGTQVAHVSSQIAARVAETAGNTGAIVVTAVTSNGQPVSGATVRVVNTTLSPTIDQTTVTDTNGTALFLDVSPDSGKDYKISATKDGYSTVNTIAASGSLIPTYPNLSVFSQQVSSSTLKIDQIADDSLKLTIVDASTGLPVPNATFSIKGGVKLYTSTSDQSYDYTQNALTVNSSGEYLFHDLTPGPYYVCFTNDTCATGKYLTVSQNAFGDFSVQPIVVPAGNVSQTGSGPMQYAKLFVSTSSTYPRIKNIVPSTFSASSSSIATTQVTITGANLSGATVSFRQGATTLSSTTVGSDTSASIKRQVNLSGKSGSWEVVITTAGLTSVQTGIAPGTLGGINVTP